MLAESGSPAVAAPAEAVKLDKTSFKDAAAMLLSGVAKEVLDKIQDGFT